MTKRIWNYSKERKKTVNRQLITLDNCFKIKF